MHSPHFTKTSLCKQCRTVSVQRWFMPFISENITGQQKMVSGSFILFTEAPVEIIMYETHLRVQLNLYT